MSNQDKTSLGEGDHQGLRSAPEIESIVSRNPVAQKIAEGLRYLIEEERMSPREVQAYLDEATARSRSRFFR